MSKAQDNLQNKLFTITENLKYTLYCEKDNKEKTTVILNNGKKHIVDFYIPEINLYIEYSGNNTTSKLFKMNIAHKTSNINYFSLIDIADKQMQLPKISDQINELLIFLQSKKEIIDICNISYMRLNKLFERLQYLIKHR